MAYKRYSTLNVLIVDDFRQFLDTLRSMLESFGVHSVDSSSSAQEAVELCKSKAYDLILCDYNLGAGKKNGLHLLELLRAESILSRNSLFVLITAEASRSVVMATYDYEPEGYLTKPFNSKLLKQRLDRLLSRRDAMKSIFDAMEHGKLNKAIQLCEAKILDADRHTLECKKLLAELYLKTHNFAFAEQAYKQIVDDRATAWAMVGLARVYYETNRTELAINMLEKVIAHTPQCMQAYDLLSMILKENQQIDRSQKVLEEAIRVSPKAILRHIQLAKTAEDNKDLQTAANAYLNSVALGRHSCHDKIENHLSLGRTTANLLNETGQDTDKLSQKALLTLDNINKRFESTTSQNAQLHLFKSQVHAGLNENWKAESSLNHAEEIIKENLEDIDLETKLVLVNALTVHGEEEKAEDALNELLEENKGNESALEKIDQLLPEPQSQENKKLVAKVNREGIELYDQQNFDNAISCFKNALKLFPRHIGVHLNLVQAILGKMKHDGPDNNLLEITKSSLSLIEKYINNEHAQFQRFKQLHEKHRSLRQEFEKRNEN